MSWHSRQGCGMQDDISLLRCDKSSSSSSSLHPCSSSLFHIHVFRTGHVPKEKRARLVTSLVSISVRRVLWLRWRDLGVQSALKTCSKWLLSATQNTSLNVIIMAVHGAIKSPIHFAAAVKRLILISCFFSRMVLNVRLCVCSRIH